MKVKTVDLPGVLPLHREHEFHDLITLKPSVNQHENVLRYTEPAIKQNCIANTYVSLIGHWPTQNYSR